MLSSLKDLFAKVQHGSQAQTQKLVEKIGRTGEKLKKRISFHNEPDGSMTGAASLDVNTEAGSKLLYKYQLEWSTLRANSSECASLAQEVDAEIHKRSIACQYLHSSCMALHAELVRLPDLLACLGQAKEKLISLHTKLEETENMLDDLEDFCCAVERKQALDSKKETLAKYRDMKRRQLEREKAVAWQEYQLRVEAKERRELAKLAEKHQAYDDAFQAQMEHYKSHGRVEDPIGRDRSESQRTTSSLDEVVFDRNADELDQFLGSPESEKSEQEDTESEPEEEIKKGEIDNDDDAMEIDDTIE
ncbi:dysbindin-like [Oscarella lobularis]|uniref:dysbindin-like n=1 Tax=Oscarella lobularis TaxID=121494 RepID=UPI00331433C6